MPRMVRTTVVGSLAAAGYRIYIGSPAGISEADGRPPEPIALPTVRPAVSLFTRRQVDLLRNHDEEPSDPALDHGHASLTDVEDPWHRSILLSTTGIIRNLNVSVCVHQ